jgi:hypothetical protein
MDSSKAESYNEESTSSENECAAGDDKEIGAVGGHSPAPQAPSSVRAEPKQEGETEDDEGNGMKEGDCKIDILNNDCLMHILSFLSKTERIKVERGMLFQVFLLCVACFYSGSFSDLLPVIFEISLSCCQSCFFHGV